LLTIEIQLGVYLILAMWWQVLIYSPARTAGQQGSGNVGIWRINFLSTQK